MVCPPKQGPLAESSGWNKLVKDIKEKFGLDDAKALKLAEIAFYKKGDMPSSEEAISILSNKRKGFVKKTIKQTITGMFNSIRKKSAADRGFAFGVAEGKTIGAIEQAKVMGAEIKKLNEKLDKGEITKQQLQDRIKELGYEVRFKEAEGKLAGEIAGKIAGRKEGIFKQKSAQAEFTEKINEYLNNFVFKGKITALQAKALSRRSINVGTSDIGFKAFTDYVDKLIENPNYDNEVIEVRKMQDAAKRIKSPLSSEIKIFTDVNVENIPLTLLPKYKQALDLLAGKVVDPKLMMEMTFDIQKIKQDSVIEKSFENVTTFNQAEDLFKKIKENKLENIEDYINTISDTNKLKTKLEQLLNDESITQEDYDAISGEISLNEKDFQLKNEKQIEDIKETFINEIKNKELKPRYETTAEEKELIQKINNIREEDLINLNVQDLYILNEAKSIANESYIDVRKLSTVLNSIEATYAKFVGEQINSRTEGSKKTNQLIDDLLKKDDTYWEYALGLPVNKVGELFLRIISPFRKGVANYVNDIKVIRKSMYDIYKKNKLKTTFLPSMMGGKKETQLKTEFHKMGMVVHFLQEYVSQFNPKLKNIKDIGARDEFFVKLNNKKYTDNIPENRSSYTPQWYKDKFKSKSTESLIKSAYDLLPKNAEGKVDPKDVYDDFINNGGKYLNENQRNAIKDIFKLFENNITDKQQYANNLRNKEFINIPYYMPREYYFSDGFMKAESPVSVSNNGKNLRIANPFGKERIADDIMFTELPKTDFVYLMNKAANNSMRDYHLTSTLQDLNAKLNTAYEYTNDTNKKYLDAVVSRMNSALLAEFEGQNLDAGVQFIDKLQSASAISILLNPLRTFIAELPSGLIAYPVRAMVSPIRAYKEIFKGSKLNDELKNYTKSPIRIKENINANFDLDTGQIILNNRLNEAAKFLSGFTEAHLNNMIWGPKFRDAFKDITGVNFDGKKFQTDKAYRARFNRELNDAGSVADQETQEIIGSTTTGSGRLVIENLLTGKLSTSSGWGKIVGYMGGYTYRDYVSLGKGFKEMSDSFKAGESYGNSLTHLSKPLGILIGVTTYGYLSSLNYYVTSYLSSLAGGSKSDEKFALDQLKNKFTIEGAQSQLAANMVQIGAGKYGSEGRMAIQALGTAMYYSTSNKKEKEAIKDFVRDVTFQKIPEFETTKGKQVSQISKAKEVSYSIVKNIAAASSMMNTIVDAEGGVDSFGKLMKEYDEGTLTGDKKERAYAAKTILTSMQVLLLTKGLSIPMQKQLNIYLDNILNPPKRTLRSSFNRN
jgi:hypothetical protein